MNRRPVASFVGTMIAIVGIAELTAGAVASTWGPGSAANSLLIGGAISATFGGFLWLSNRRKPDEHSSEFHRREALAAVGIGWTVAVVFGALRLYVCSAGCYVEKCSDGFVSCTLMACST